MKSLKLLFSILGFCLVVTIAQAQKFQNNQLSVIQQQNEVVDEVSFSVAKTRPRIRKQPTASELSMAKARMNVLKKDILSSQHELMEFGEYQSLRLQLNDSDEIELVDANGTLVRRVENSSSSKQIVVRGNHLDNTLVITQQIIDLGYDVLYLGNSQQTSKGDLLIVGESTDATYENITVTHFNANDGVVEINNKSTITFVGLEPLTLGGTAADLIINLPNTANPDVVLQNEATSGANIISGSTFEATTFLNPSSSLTINGGTLEDDLSVQGLDAAFAANLELIVNSDNDQITFETNTTNVGVGNVDITAEFLSFSATLATEGDIIIDVDKSLDVTSGGVISVLDGEIDIDAGVDIQAGDNFVGTLINGGTINAIGDGEIRISSNGAADGSGNRHGVQLANAAVIEVLGTGDIQITGNGGNGTTSNIGVTIVSANTRVSANGGDIVINGESGSSTSNNNVGFILNNAAEITNNGGDITISGTSNGQGNSARGVRILGNNTSISTTNGGNIDITGIANDGGNNCYGIEFWTGTSISSDMGNVQLSGTGDGTGENGYGLYLNGQINTNSGNISLVGQNDSTAGSDQLIGIFAAGSTSIETMDGAISLTGNGGTGTGSFSIGTLLAFGADVIATGLGEINISGIAGQSTAADYGVLFQNSGTVVRSNGGGITINATGGINTSSTTCAGVVIINSSLIEDTQGGEINITGQGGAGLANNFGVAILNSAVNVTGDDLIIDGVGGSGPNGSNVGVALDTATLSNTTTGDIDISGLGGTGTDTNFGVLIDENSSISTEDGDIEVVGESIEGAVEGAIVIASPLTITGSGDILLDGEAPSATERAINLFTEAAILTSAGGDIEFLTRQGVLNTPDGQATVSLCNGGRVLINEFASPGQTVGQFTMNAKLEIDGGVLTIDVNDFTTPGTDYDQIVVNGEVEITPVDLVLVDNTTSTAASFQSMVLIDNDGSDAITGQFTGINNGDAISFNGETWYIYYDGGDGNDAVLQSAPTNVIVDGSGNLVYTDNLGEDDDLFIFVEGTNYRIGDYNKPVAAGLGAIQDGDEVLVPIASVTGDILINTLDGDDNLEVLFDGGVFSDAILYEGGNQTNGDALSLDGGASFDTVTHTLINANDGNVAITGNGLITYTGLEPVIDNLEANDRIFTFTGGAETITLSDDATATDDISLIDSDLSESVAFVNPLNTLTVNAGTGEDTVNIEGLDGLFDAALTVNGDEEDDTVNFQTNPTTTTNGDITVISEEIYVSEDLTTTGNVTLTADKTAEVINGSTLESSDGNITIIGGNAPTAGDDFLGVRVVSGTVRTTGMGNISIMGTGSFTSLNSRHGVTIRNSGTIETTGSGSIQLNGTGGNGDSANMGVEINAGTVTSNGGGISVNGTGGNGTGNTNRGILVYNGSQIRDINGGSINFTGLGGDGATTNHGVQISNTSTLVETNNGSIIFVGTGGNGSGNFNEGILITQATVQDVGAGSITMNATGGDGAAFNRGFEVINGASILSNGGDISLTGIGGNGTGNFNVGMSIRNNNPTVSTTGAGTISIVGTGGVAGSSNFGAELTGDTVVSSENGNITITGTAPDTTSGGQDGLRLAASITSSNGGNIDLTGTSGTSGGWAVAFLTNTVLVQTSGDVTIDANNSERFVTATAIPPANLIDANTITINGDVRPGDNNRTQLPVAGALTFASDDILRFNIAAFTTPGTDYDQIVVAGTVELSDTTLSLTNNTGSSEDACETIVLIDNDGTDAVIGTFNGIPEGGIVNSGGITGLISYVGGDGNDVTLNFDSTPPVAVCMDITVQLDANGMASITPSDIDGGSTDNCGIASLSVSPSTFDCSDVGTNTVTMTVTDVNGNSSTCTAVVTVEDNVPPVAVCMDITIALEENGMASITPADVDGGSSDACGIADLSIDVMDFTCGDVGPNNVTLTVTDNNGNTSTCIAVVTVVDDMPPAISCPADVVTGVNTGECGAIVTFADAIAFDICGIASVTQTDGLPSGSFFPVGVSTIEFTAEDVNGNTSVCSFTITVEDDEAPMAICQNITVELDANGNASITPADVDGGSTDNCGVITDISIDIDTFDCSNLGDNPVVLSVTDDNGNTGSCTAIVTVIDVTAPEAICMDITVALDASGNATIVATDVDGGSTDACGVTSYSIDVDTFDCSHVGDNPVVLTVTDASGNSSSCTAIVTVEDTTNPVVECMDIIVGLDQNGQASITATDLVASATDACGIDSISADITEFDCDDLAAPVAVNVFVTDINGNLSTCTALVTVKDGLDPVISCPADQTIEITDGSQYEVPDYFATGEITAVDNCTDPVVITTQDPTPGTLLDEGTYTITVTAEDDSGNVAICDFEITIVGVLGNNDRLDITSIGMYPNPASEVVMISNPQHIELEQAMIFDLTGRLIQTFDLRAMSDSISLDISMLSTATYTVVIQAAEGQISKRLIKN